MILTTRLHSVRSATSEWQVWKSVPSAARSRAQRASSSTTMSVAQTFAPATPNARAIPHPKPRAAPVTRATRFLKGIIVGSFQFPGLQCPDRSRHAPGEMAQPPRRSAQGAVRLWPGRRLRASGGFLAQGAGRPRWWESRPIVGEGLWGFRVKRRLRRPMSAHLIPFFMTVTLVAVVAQDHHIG